MKLETITNNSNSFIEKIIMSISFVFLISNNFTGMSSVFPILRIISMVLLVVVGFYNFLLGSKIYYKSYIIWGGLFLFILVLSLFYTEKIDLAWNGIFAYITIFIPVFFMIQPIKTSKDFDKLMNIIIISGTSLSAVSMIFFRDELFSKGRFWAIGNPNAIMSMLLLPILVIIFKLFTEKNKKVINCLCLMLCIVLMLFTGSRKGLLIPLVFMFVFVVLNNKNKVFKRLIFIGLVLLIIFVMIFMIPELYFALGRRVQWFYDTLFDSDNRVYFSDVLRLQLRKDALNMFFKSPIIGLGVNSFAAQYGVYSHNNYTEILSATGVIGFILYYWISICNFYKLFKAKELNMSIKKYRDFALSLIIALFVYDWGAVTYNTLKSILGIAICILITTIVEKQKGKEYE